MNKIQWVGDNVDEICMFTMQMAMFNGKFLKVGGIDDEIMLGDWIVKEGDRLYVSEGSKN